MQNPISPILIETDRLILRPLQDEDLPDLCRLDTDPDVRAYFPEGVITPEQIQQELVRYKREWDMIGFGMFGILEKSTGRFMGRGGFAKILSGEVEFGYLLFKEHWGKGFATEAAQGFLAWGTVHIPADRIVGFARIDHVESRRIFEKCGMRYFKTDLYRQREWAFYEYHITPSTF